MDKYSRRVVGWSYGPRKDVKLTLEALNRAVGSRRPAQAWCSTPIGHRICCRGFQRAHLRLGFTQSMTVRAKSPTTPSIEPSSTR